MPRIIVLVYIIASAAIAIITTVLQIQPAILTIDIIAPNPGDTFSLSLVMLVTWLILLLPLIFVMIIIKLVRTKSVEIIGPERTGVFVIRQKSFEGALVGIPIFINSKKVGTIDNGKSKFFDVPAGDHILQAGKGKQASEKLEVKVNDKDQLYYEFSLLQDGLFLKIELKEFAKV